jgi:hypothetical protein
MLGRDSHYKDTQGTAVVQVGALTFACVGLSETALLRKQIPFKKIYVLPNDHASYYPGASQITLKLLFAPDSGKILGAQAVGCGGVDKRIDVLAVAQRAGLTRVSKVHHVEGDSGDSTPTAPTGSTLVKRHDCRSVCWSVCCALPDSRSASAHRPAHLTFSSYIALSEDSEA